MSGILWFHRDLRTSDHAGLQEALRSGGSWVALVAAALEGTNPARRFLNECQDDLEVRLAQWDIPLHRVPVDSMAEWIQTRFREQPSLRIVTSRRYNTRDLAVFEGAVRLIPTDQIRVFDHATLYLESDLPFELSALPSTFTPFFRKVEGSRAPVRAPLDWALREPGHPDAAPPVVRNGRSFEFTGGETAAIRRLHGYLHGYPDESKAVLHYADTRNGLLEVDDSSKLSPYLAQGCVSARQVYAAILGFEAISGEGPGTRALKYELVWRDYFKFLSLLHGEKIFSLPGLKKDPPDCRDDPKLFEAWCSASTGQDFVDANLRELNETGWMSNRGRQNVASFFAKTMRLPWTLGAESFAKHLIDYDVETNWGNWMYLAGVGTDPRDRRFDPALQARTYDPDGAYRRRWG
jgi:deoxyribodipyrimidine photo-lyase